MSEGYGSRWDAKQERKEEAVAKRAVATQCPNCPDGRMTVRGDGSLWCDRCEVPQPAVDTK